MIMIIIGIQMARCTRVASRESLPRALAETVTQRPRPRPRRSKTVAETETESRDEATSTSASHTQMANKRHSRVYFMLPAEAEAAEQTEARSASGCIRVRRASNMLHVVFEVRAVCSVATVLFIFRQTLCVCGGNRCVCVILQRDTRPRSTQLLFALRGLIGTTPAVTAGGQTLIPASAREDCDIILIWDSFSIMMASLPPPPV